MKHLNGINNFIQVLRHPNKYVNFALALRTLKQAVMPLALVSFVYLVIDHRSHANYGIPTFEKARVFKGTLEVLDRRQNKGAFKISQNHRHIVVGCIPNMDFLNCATPELRTKYNGETVTVRYFVMKNAKIYENIVLQIEYEDRVLLSYNDRVSALRQREKSESEFPLWYYIFAVVIGFALNNVGNPKKRKPQ